MLCASSRAIAGAIGRAPERRSASDDDDLAAPARDHLRQDGANQAMQRVDEAVEDLGPLLVGGFMRPGPGIGNGQVGLPWTPLITQLTIQWIIENI